MTGLYEQIKNDLGYLQLTRVAEVFAPLSDESKAHEWTHIEHLARLRQDHLQPRPLASPTRQAEPRSRDADSG